MSSFLKFFLFFIILAIISGCISADKIVYDYSNEEFDWYWKKNYSKETEIREVRINYSDTVFPNKTLSELENLEYLDIWFPRRYYIKAPKPLKIDSALLHSLKGLKGLRLIGYNLGKFPTEFLILDSLEYLALEICELTSLPLNLNRLTNLRTLYLVYNNIEEIPPNLILPQHLEVIVLRQNFISKVSPQPFINSSVEKLDLDSQFQHKNDSVYTKSLNVLEISRFVSKIDSMPNLKKVIFQIESCSEYDYIKKIENIKKHRKKFKIFSKDKRCDGFSLVH